RARPGEHAVMSQPGGGLGGVRAGMGVNLGHLGEERLVVWAVPRLIAVELVVKSHFLHIWQDGDAPAEAGPLLARGRRPPHAGRVEVIARPRLLIINVRKAAISAFIVLKRHSHFPEVVPALSLSERFADLIHSEPDHGSNPG